MRIFVLMFLCFFIAASSANSSMISQAELRKKADNKQCVNWHKIGKCLYAPDVPGVLYEYWAPVFVVETINNPGETLVQGKENVVKSCAGVQNGRVQYFPDESKEKRTLETGGRSHYDGTALQIKEVHVFPFSSFGGLLSVLRDVVCESVPEVIAGGINYCSEKDAREWRVGEKERESFVVKQLSKFPNLCSGIVPFPLLCAGRWGPIFPRVGFSVQPDDAVYSALSVVRAVSLINIIQPGTAQHVVSIPVAMVPFTDWDKMQMVYPKTSAHPPCIKIGADPRNYFSWPNHEISKDGNYAWVYWRRKTCCRPIL